MYNPDTDHTAVELKPFHTLDLKKDDEVLKWLKDTYTRLRTDYGPRHRMQKAFLSLYKGFYLDEGPNSASRETLASSKGMQARRVGVNHTFDLIEQRVSKQVRFKSSTVVVPQNSSYSSESSAKISKQVLDTAKQKNKYDTILEKSKRFSMIFGEQYVFVTWDPNKGPIHPDAKKLMAEGKPIPILENGEPTGEHYKAAPRIGDMSLRVRYPWEVFEEPTENADEVDWVFTIDLVHVDTLKKDYPDQADEIKETGELDIYDSTSLESRALKNHAVVYNFWHVGTEDNPKGIYFKATNDVFLIEPKETDLPDDVEYPSSYKSLPFEKLTDVDIPGEQFAFPTLHNIENLQVIYDKLTTLLVRNAMLCSHPKWMVPKGTCNISQLGNKTAILEYSGAKEPKLAVYQALPRDVFELRADFKQEMEQVFGIQGSSRGTPPPNTRAAASLVFFDEQENERASTEIRKYHEFIVALDTKLLALASEKYLDHDQRLISIVGEDDGHLIKNFDVSDLKKWDKIQVQNLNQFPQNRYARIETTLQLAQAVPSLITKEMIADSLEIMTPTTTESAERKAVLSAESENEDFVHSRKVEPPVVWEKHLQHWQTHLKFMQSRSFKDLSKEIQDRFKSHVAAHEELMKMAAEGNQTYAQLVAQLPQFPIFAVEDEEEILPASAGEIPQGGTQQAPQPPQGQTPQPIG